MPKDSSKTQGLNIIYEIQYPKKCGINYSLKHGEYS